MVKAKLEGQIILNYTIVTEVEDLKELPNEYESLVLSENYQELLLKSEFISVEEISMDIEKAKEIVAIKIGESYDFLFEGKNNEYDEEYKDFIEETEENGKMYNEQDMKSLKGVLRQFINSNGGNIDFGIAEESDIKAVRWAIEQIEKLEKENDRLRNKNNKLIQQMGTAFENDQL